MNYTIDAKGKVVGRLASEIAILLNGKHLPSYRTNQVPDVHISVFNTDLLKMTGKKLGQKLYRRHSGVLGNLKEETAKHLLERDSRKLIRLAVSGMLPKNKLRSRRLTQIRFYKKEIHT